MATKQVRVWVTQDWHVDLEGADLVGEEKNSLLTISDGDVSLATFKEWMLVRVMEND
jgi:hypothetical protein